MTRLVKQIEAEVRERCAKIAEEIARETDSEGEIYIARKIADAIRRTNQ